jgi:DUF1365 family protein
VSVSAVYEGSVRHRRFAEREHRFRQRLALAFIDLDELEELCGGRLVARRPGLLRFRRGDYLGDPRTPLSVAVRDLVEDRIRVRPHGPVRMLANLSALGHCFNPVSFYYCMDAPGVSVEAVVAEVTNTPWGERQAYVLAAPVPRRVLRGSFAKELHVSPFMGMDHRYEWRMTEPAQTLSVHIVSSRGGRVAFDATLSLRRRELSSAGLARCASTTLRTLVSIYGQAAMLKFKGVPVRAHPQAHLP